MVTYSGGAGDDTLPGGGSPTTGDDLYYGEAGDDIIYGGAGTDTAFGGVGDDTIYGGDDAGDGQLNGHQGNDVVYGVDAVNGSSGDDSLYAGAGGDRATGGQGADELYGDSGDDQINGDSGDDTLDGGLGVDSLNGGAGDDDLNGNDGDYTFYVTDGASADSVDGDADAGDGDNGVLDLTAFTATGTHGITYAGGDDEDGTVTFYDGSGGVIGTLVFEEIETIICFAKGTQITTPNGAVNVEDLQAGDLVATRDNGLKPIRWIGSRKVPAKGKFAPVMFRKGVIGNQNDLLVSPQHRVLIEGWKAEILFGEPEVLAAAKMLVNGDTIYSVESEEVEYFHILFDTHELILSEGAWTESFHPGEMGLGSMAEEAREEILTLFPELEMDVNSYGPSARMSLKSDEAKILTQEPGFLKQD